MIRRRTFPIILLLTGLLVSLIPGWTSVAHAQIDDAQYRRDLAAIASHPSRIIGSEGYEKTAAYLEEQIGALPGVELQKHEYPVMVPVTRSATLSLNGGSTENVYPFWPAHVRVNSTPAEGFTGNLVYVGHGGYDEIKPASLMGQIAVIEATSAEMWRQAAYFGARAIILLGSPRVTNEHLQHHDLTIPLNLPRFYVPHGAFADQLRRGEVTGPATLKAQVVWTRYMARNYYALVRSPLLASVEKLPRSAQWAVGQSVNVSPAGWTGSTPPAALMISVPFESSGLVPDLARGASQAAQTAAGLALLRDLSKQPLNRPVVVFFGGADSIQFLATRTMFLALSDVPAAWRKELDLLAKKQEGIANELRRANEIERDPRKIDVSGDRALIDRLIKLVETDAALEQNQLFRLRVRPKEELTAEMAAEARHLEDRQVLFNRLRFSFQQEPQQLGGEMLDEARAYLDRAIVQLKRLEKQYAEKQWVFEERVRLYRWLADSIHRNADPDPRSNNSRLIEMLVALDLSDNGVRFGPMFFGQFQRTSNISQIQDYRDWFTRKERQFQTESDEREKAAKAGRTPGNWSEDARWFGTLRGVFDLEPLSQSRAPQTYIGNNLPIGTEMAQAWGTPGFSLVTLDDLRLLRDTPNDTLENLKVDAILPQLHGVRSVLWKAWNDPAFKGQIELKWQRTGVSGQVVSPAPGRPVPDLPREGFLATYYHITAAPKKIPPLRSFPWTNGIRRNEVRDCDAEGNYRFEGIARLHTDMQVVAVQVYRIDETSGAITASTDLGKQAGDIKWSADLRQDLNPLRSLVFNCTEFSLVGLYDPRFMQSLGEVLPLDARRNAELQRYNMLLKDQMLAGFLEPGMSAYLLFRYGRVGNRLVLLNMADAQAAGDGAQPGDSERKAARGFSVPALNDIPALSLVTAHDFWRLDEIRLRKYEKAGVSSSLVDSLHNESKQQIERAETAMAEDRGSDMVSEINGAWANETRVYLAAQAMAGDVVRAAIFLLLLCVPFSFCMERLIVGTPSIYKQIAGLLVIFSIMAAALWSFHPAFEISSSPLIIILAFAIIFMSLVVISVVYGKFDTELKRIRSGRGTSQGTSFASASVLMSAVLLGIANMRKRKFRTMLTSITIVLITFAVLCFTSASRYVGTTTLPTGEPTQYPGLMLRQRGFRAMPQIVLQNLKAVLGQNQQIVERWWNVNAWEPKDQIHVVASPQFGNTGVALASADSALPSGDAVAQALSARPKIFAAQAVLGLSPGESKLSTIAEVIGSEKYARLENGEARIVYLSNITAQQLGVSEGTTVRIGGIDVEVAGIYDADEFDSRVRMLSGEQIAPLKYTSDALDSGGRRLRDNAADDLDLSAESAGSELDSVYEHLSSSQFIIVPASLSQVLPNATLRTVAFRLPDQEAVKTVSEDLSRRLAVAMFAGFENGVQMVAASDLAQVGGMKEVAVPLAIAGLIIFNTMMGSIAERRREIHVYTSLGLAPLHVGALFVAEAMTYGLIGTVFGYVIGQGVGTALLKLGWLGNVTMNYSGTSAMLTMGLILLIVLLSALVPARLASKIAAPSIERNWRVPLPKGDEIVAMLPFTINKTAAQGALAYLAEYFDAHQEGSIGKFSAGKVEAFTFEDDKGQTSRGLKTVVWLTPFDLGVRQHLMLLIHPGQFPDIYEVQLVLQRLSGDDGSWYRMNRTFLTEMRKQFLQWRSLSPQRMLEYVEESRRLFAEKPAQVVTTTGGEALQLG